MSEKERKKEQRRLNMWNKQHRLIDEVDYKLCNRCEEWLPATTEYFYENKHNRIDGLFPYCKKCSIEKIEQWTLENREYSRKSRKDYYTIEDNRIKKNLRDKQWREKNKERKQEYQLQWQRDNKDKLKEYNEQHNTHKITNKEWVSCLEYFNNSCAYCGMHQDIAKETFNNYLHKDHVIHKGKNDLSNCVPACKICNSKKWTFTLSEWYNINNPIYSKKRHNKIIKWLENDYKKYIVED